MTLGIFFYTFYEVSSVAIRLFMLCYVPQRHNPTTAMSWLLAIYLWPWMGFLLYGIFGSTTLPRERILRHESLLKRLKPERKTFRRTVSENPFCLPEELARFGALAEKLGDMVITSGNDLALIDDSALFIKILCGEIAEARKSVHLLFYIFALDSLTEPLFEELEKAARRGVECLLLVDALGSKVFLRKDTERLTAAGVRVVRALPPGLLRRTDTTARYDLRNHRKIAVIDGAVGYTGSHNIIEPSYGGKAKGRLWHDLTLRLTGPVVAELQGVFLEDWYVETGELLSLKQSFSKPDCSGLGVVQVLPSGPSYPLQNFQRLVVAALHGSREQVTITTPYLIPDEELLHALETAVLGGVRIRLVVPEKGDQFLVGSAAKAYFSAFLAMGVEIWLYQEGILHSKTMTVDGNLAFLGTSNFDIRSFALNFELNLILYGEDESASILSAQEKYIALSRRLTAEEWSRLGLPVQVLHGITKLFSPLL